MNRYEYLAAPPSLKSKELSIHIKMQHGLDREKCNQFSLDLLNPKLKLEDELTTLRFPLKPCEGDDADYIAICRALTGAKGDPIPFRFFGSECKRLREEAGLTGAPTARDRNRLRAAVEAIDDAWRYQGYAALYLRVAQNSETQDPQNAAAAWKLALAAYEKFFARAKAAESYAWQYQTEEKQRALCAEIWAGFRRSLIEQIAVRLKEYIKAEQAEPVEACLAALALPEARAIDPSAHDRALEAAFLPYIGAIQGAANLSAALPLYENCPSALRAADTKGDLARAVLAAIKNEAELLERGFGDTGLIAKAAGLVKASELYAAGNTLARQAASECFEACAVRIRSIVQKDDPSAEDDKQARALLGLMPADFMIAHGEGNKKLCRADIEAILLPRRLLKLFDKLPKGGLTAQKVRAIGKQVYETAAREAPCGSEQYAEIMAGVVGMGFNRLEKLGGGREMMAAYLESFPDDTPIHNENCKTVGELRSAIGVTPELRLIAELAQAKAGSKEEESAARAVIRFVYDNPNAVAQGESFKVLADKVLLQTIVACSNLYAENHANKQAQRTILVIADYMPNNTPLPNTSGEKLLLGDHIRQLEAVSIIRALTAAQTGTIERLSLVTELIVYAGDMGGRVRINGEKLIDLARKVLLQEFIICVNAYTSNPGDSLSKAGAQTIGGFLQGSTVLPTGGGPRLTVSMLMIRLNLTPSSISRRYCPPQVDPVPRKKTAVSKQASQKQTKQKPQKQTKQKPQKQAKRKPAKTKPVQRSAAKRRTTVNGLKLRGGRFLAGIQYYCLLIVLTGACTLGIGLLTGWNAAKLYAPGAFVPLLATAMFIGALAISGLLNLFERSPNGILHYLRFKLWWLFPALLAYAVLPVLGVNLTNLPTPLRVTAAIYAFTLIAASITILERMRQRKYGYGKNIHIRYGMRTLWGGPWFAWLEYLWKSCTMPCAIWLGIWCWQRPVEGVWMQVLEIVTLMFALDIVGCGFACMASRFRRVGKLLGGEWLLLMFPAIAGYLIWRNAWPLTHGAILAFGSVYGIIFLVCTIKNLKKALR